MEAGSLAGGLHGAGAPAAGVKPGGGLLKWLFTTDHKLIGVMYMWLGFIFFAIGGIFALLLRTQLFAPGLQVLAPQVYNQIMSLHGTFMIFFFTIPLLAGLGNYVVPIQIGARDMAFPRLNAISFWLLIPAGLMMLTSMFVQGGTAAGGERTPAGRPPNARSAALRSASGSAAPASTSVAFAREKREAANAATSAWVSDARPFSVAVRRP